MFRFTPFDREISGSSLPFARFPRGVAQGSGRPSVVRRSPEDQLEGLKALYNTATGEFVWERTPENDPRGRGLYPSWTWTSAWYAGALDYGYQPEDIGFELHDLYVAWFNFVEKHFPGHPRNNQAFDPVSYEHRMPWDNNFVFPNKEY